ALGVDHYCTVRDTWLRDLIYWYMPTALLRGIFHNVPDSCFRQWIK
ncbi:TPA: type IV conjugative transfer system protein TraL, partial [Escherichia coli]